MSITLDALPLDVIHRIAQQLAADPKRRVRDVVSLAFVSKNLYDTVSKLDTFWARWSRSIFGRPRRAGQVVAPLPEPGWIYFSRRMRARHRLHRTMRALLARLGGTTSMMPGEGHRELLGLELQLDRELPEELWDLWRFYGGQPIYARSGIFNGARMLTVSEVVELLQPASGADGRGPGAAEGSGQVLFHQSAEVAALQQGDDERDRFMIPHSALPSPAPSSAVHAAGNKGQGTLLPHAALSPCAGLHPPVIPLSDTVRGGKYYAMDPSGAVLLMSGLYAHRVAGSLSEFIQATLLR